MRFRSAKPRPVKPGPTSALNVRRVTVLAVVTALTCLLVPTASPSQAVGRWVDPGKIRALVGHDQAIIVQANNLTSSWAWVTAWERRSGTWVKVRGPIQSRIGSTGLSNRAVGDRRQNDGSTPTGAYAMGLTFGKGANPGTKMPWRTFDSSDYWTYDPKDPKTYNIYQVTRPKSAKWRVSWAERLASYGKQYEFAAVVRFNTPNGVYYSGSQYMTKTPANTSRGGGIFLHVNGAGATAGCISVPRNDALGLIKWMNPAKKPMIAIGTPTILPKL